MESNRVNVLGLAGQIGRFGLVGALATLTHVSLFTGLVKAGLASPLTANCLAFVPAFTLSFYGHFAWTFRCTHLKLKRQIVIALVKFLVAALIGLALNSLWVYLVTDVLRVEYYYTNLFFVFVTPGFLFAFNKFIVFR